MRLKEADEKLKPCPFCGGKAHLLNMGWPHWVFCSECGAKVQGVGFAEDGDVDAIERWNSRVEPTVEPKRGHWKPHLFSIVNVMGYECSECKRPNLYDENYCPFCGARMEKRDEADE